MLQAQPTALTEQGRGPRRKLVAVVLLVARPRPAQQHRQSGQRDGAF